MKLLYSNNYQFKGEFYKESAVHYRTVREYSDRLRKAEVTGSPPEGWFVRIFRGKRFYGNRDRYDEWEEDSDTEGPFNTLTEAAFNSDKIIWEGLAN